MVLNCSGNDTIFKINPEWKMEAALRHDGLFYSSVSVPSPPKRRIHRGLVSVHVFPIPHPSHLAGSRFKQKAQSCLWIC